MVTVRGLFDKAFPICFGGEGNEEGRSLSFDRFAPDSSSMPLNKDTAQVESQTDAFNSIDTCILRPHKLLKDLLLLLCWDTNPVIADSKEKLFICLRSFVHHRGRYTSGFTLRHFHKHLMPCEIVHQHQMHKNRAERISDLSDQGTAMRQHWLMLLAFFGCPPQNQKRAPWQMRRNLSGLAYGRERHCQICLK